MEYGTSVRRAKGCTHAILAHNHPSGSLKPSKEDIDVTDRLYQCGLILSIPIHDHMILNMMSFITFKDNGLMAKIAKSLKYKPNFKVVAEMKAEAEEIRQKALEEGRKEGVAAGKMLGLAEGEIIGFDKGEVAGIDKGLIQGKDIGKQEEKIEMAKSMLKDGTDINFIMKHTGLTVDEINKIKKDMGL